MGPLAKNPIHSQGRQCLGTPLPSLEQPSLRLQITHSSTTVLTERNLSAHHHPTGKLGPNRDIREPTSTLPPQQSCCPLREMEITPPDYLLPTWQHQGPDHSAPTQGPQFRAHVLNPGSSPRNLKGGTTPTRCPKKLAKRQTATTEGSFCPPRSPTVQVTKSRLTLAGVGEHDQPSASKRYSRSLSYVTGPVHSQGGGVLPMSPEGHRQCRHLGTFHRVP